MKLVLAAFFFSFFSITISNISAYCRDVTADVVFAQAGINLQNKGIHVCQNNAFVCLPCAPTPPDTISHKMHDNYDALVRIDKKLCSLQTKEVSLEVPVH